MKNNAQNVLDTPNANTIFLVWNFKQNVKILPVFQRICALMSNLNNSAQVRTTVARASVVMGISYQAWKKLQLPEPLPKELIAFQPMAIYISIFAQMIKVILLIWQQIFLIY